MDAVKLGIKLLVIIMAISLVFSLIRIFASKYLDDFYRELSAKISRLIKLIFKN